MILAIGTRNAAPAVAMLACLLLSGGAWGEPMKTAGRTRGPSPFGVFFDATSSASGVLLPPAVDGRRDFSTYHYEWDFGDPRSPVFPSNGRSSNRGHGHLAAHIFATPGTFTVTLTVHAPDGRRRVFQQEIIALDPERVFANSSPERVEGTFYVSAEGNDANNGSRRHPFGSWNYGLERLFASGGPKRVLFRRGDRFITKGFRSHRFSGPLLIGAFGKGPDPIVFGDTDRAILMGGRGTNLTITGIHFMSSYDPVTGMGRHPDVLKFSDANSELTIYRNTFTGAGLNIHVGQMGELTDSVIASNTITSWHNYGILSGRVVRTAIIGNSIRQHPSAGTGDGKHPDPPEPDFANHGPIRLRSADRTLIASNDLFSNTGWSSGPGGTRAHQPCLRIGSGGPTDLVIIADNRLEGGLCIAGDGPGRDNPKTRFGNIWERNTLIAPAGTRRFLTLSFGGAVVRNNYFFRPDTGGTILSVIEFPATHASEAERRLLNRVLNNTYVSLEQSGRDRSNFLVVDKGGMEVFLLRNNIMYAPNDRHSGAMIQWRSTAGLDGLDSDYNLSFTGSRVFARIGRESYSLEQWQRSFDDDRFSLNVDPRRRRSSPADPGLRVPGDDLERDSPAINAGGSDPAVRLDLFGRERKPGGAIDIGAVENGLGSEPPKAPSNDR